MISPRPFHLHVDCWWFLKLIFSPAFPDAFSPCSYQQKKELILRQYHPVKGIISHDHYPLILEVSWVMGVSPVIIQFGIFGFSIRIHFGHPPSMETSKLSIETIVYRFLPSIFLWLLHPHIQRNNLQDLSWFIKKITGFYWIPIFSCRTLPWHNPVRCPLPTR